VVSHKIRIQLELNPARTAKSLLDDLIKDNPDKFNIGNLRVLQKRTAQWRKEQNQNKSREIFSKGSYSK